MPQVTGRHFWSDLKRPEVLLQRERVTEIMSFSKQSFFWSVELLLTLKIIPDVFCAIHCSDSFYGTFLNINTVFSAF